MMAHSVSDEVESKDIEMANHSSSHRQTENHKSVHKVGLPPRRNFIGEFSETLKETFFSDDPLRPYKDQPRSRQLVLGLRFLFPVLEWGRSYNLSKFKGDVIAGLTIASLCIPQDIGYAKLANMDAKYGLYSSFVPPLIYAVMGSSRDIAIGPVAVVSLLLGTLLQNEVDPEKNKEDYRRLAFTATFFAGVTQAALGFLRLGFLIEFLSHAAIVGFMGGAAITIALQQLKGFLGIRKFTKNTDIISVMKSVWGSVHHGWNWETILIGTMFLAFLLSAKYIGKKNRKFFWVPAIAPLISVILSTFFVYVTRADKHDVQIVRKIDRGLNPSSVSQIHFSGSYAAKGFRIGVVAGLIALTEAIAIGRTFASMKEYQLDGNKEMVAIGTMNIVGSMTSCYVATGSFSRSAVNFMAGCQTSVSNIVMSMVVMLTLLVITPLFKYTPNAILSSIIISAVISLIDYEAAFLIWKVDKLDFIACMGAFFGVVFVDVEIGLLIAVRTSIACFPLFELLKGSFLCLLISIAMDFFFSPAQIGFYIACEGPSQIKFLIVEMSPVTDIDTSGIHAFEELYRSLQKHEIQLVLANPGPVVIQKLHLAKFTELIGHDKIFLSVGEAVMTCTSKAREDS